MEEMVALLMVVLSLAALIFIRPRWAEDRLADLKKKEETRDVNQKGTND